MEIGQYQELASRYYRRAAKTIYGADYFLKTNERDQKVVLTYCTLINNTHADYSNMQKAKQTLSLPMYDINEVTDFEIDPTKNTFVIHKGKVCGDITAAKEFSKSILDTYESKCLEPSFNRRYELALYVSFCIKDEVKEYIPIPDSFYVNGTSDVIVIEPDKKLSFNQRASDTANQEIVHVISSSTKDVKLNSNMFDMFGLAFGLK